MPIPDSLPDVDLAGRYLVVSVMNVVNHQVVLYIGNSVLEQPAAIANIVAATITAIPAYVVSRQWVWKSEGDARSQILPFWLIAIVGLVVSTAFAAGAEAVAGSGLAVNLAALAGYFLVWVGKFFLLDRLFRPAVVA